MCTTQRGMQFLLDSSLYSWTIFVVFHMQSHCQKFRSQSIKSIQRLHWFCSYNRNERFEWSTTGRLPYAAYADAARHFNRREFQEGNIEQKRVSSAIPPYELRSNNGSPFNGSVQLDACMFSLGFALSVRERQRVWTHFHARASAIEIQAFRCLHVYVIVFFIKP